MYIVMNEMKWVIQMIKLSFSSLFYFVYYNVFVGALVFKYEYEIVEKPGTFYFVTLSSDRYKARC